MDPEQAIQEQQPEGQHTATQQSEHIADHNSTGSSPPNSSLTDFEASMVQPSEGDQAVPQADEDIHQLEQQAHEADQAIPGSSGEAVNDAALEDELLGDEAVPRSSNQQEEETHQAAVEAQVEVEGDQALPREDAAAVEQELHGDQAIPAESEEAMLQEAPELLGDQTIPHPEIQNFVQLENDTEQSAPQNDHEAACSASVSTASASLASSRVPISRAERVSSHRHHLKTLHRELNKKVRVVRKKQRRKKRHKMFKLHSGSSSVVPSATDESEAEAELESTAFVAAPSLPEEERLPETPEDYELYKMAMQSRVTENMNVDEFMITAALGVASCDRTEGSRNLSFIIHQLINKQYVEAWQLRRLDKRAWRLLGAQEDLVRAVYGLLGRDYDEPQPQPQPQSGRKKTSYVVPAAEQVATNDMVVFGTPQEAVQTPSSAAEWLPKDNNLSMFHVVKLQQRLLGTKRAIEVTHDHVTRRHTRRLLLLVCSAACVLSIVLVGISSSIVEQNSGVHDGNRNLGVVWLSVALLALVANCILLYGTERVVRDINAELSREPDAEDANFNFRELDGLETVGQRLMQLGCHLNLLSLVVASVLIGVTFGRLGGWEQFQNLVRDSELYSQNAEHLLTLNSVLGIVLVLGLLVSSALVTIIVTMYEMLQSMSEVIAVGFALVSSAVMVGSVWLLIRVFQLREKVETISTWAPVLFFVGSGYCLSLSLYTFRATWTEETQKLKKALALNVIIILPMLLALVSYFGTSTTSDIIHGNCRLIVNTFDQDFFRDVVGCAKYSGVTEVFEPSLGYWIETTGIGPTVYCGAEEEDKLLASYVWEQNPVQQNGRLVDHYGCLNAEACCDALVSKIAMYDSEVLAAMVVLIVVAVLECGILYYLRQNTPLANELKLLRHDNARVLMLLLLLITCGTVGSVLLEFYGSIGNVVLEDYEARINTPSKKVDYCLAAAEGQLVEVDGVFTYVNASEYSCPEVSSCGLNDAEGCCINGLLDGLEAGVDCGCSCFENSATGSRCALDSTCTLDCDCETGCCVDGTCSLCPDDWQLLKCFNGVLDEGETCVDGGGPTCRQEECVETQLCLYGTLEDNITCSKCDTSKPFPQLGLDKVCDPCDYVEDTQQAVAVVVHCQLLGQLCGEGQGCVVNEDCASGLCFASECFSVNNALRDGDETDVDCGGLHASLCADGATCFVDGDCAGGSCEANVCVGCADGLRNGQETDVDCGGACKACADGATCSVGDDCASGICSDDNLCISYFNGVQDGAETDVDCGGSLEFKCDVGDTCHSASDCLSSSCSRPLSFTSASLGPQLSKPCVFPFLFDGQVFTTCVNASSHVSLQPFGYSSYSSSSSSSSRMWCATVNQYDVSDKISRSQWGFCDSSHVPPGMENTKLCTSSTTAEQQCSDGALNGDETDIDCGGSCRRYERLCGTGLRCESHADCASSSCMGEVCVSCNDGALNGDETDIDCGGSCEKCKDYSSCLVDADCQSKMCDGENKLCVSCYDGLLNGDETDVDCGGSKCAMMSDFGQCYSGQRCLTGSDCSSNSCVANVCVSCYDGLLNGDETDVDCGGLGYSASVVTPRCASGKRCKVSSDCQSELCVDSICVTKAESLPAHCLNGEIDIEEACIDGGDVCNGFDDVNRLCRDGEFVGFGNGHRQCRSGLEANGFCTSCSDDKLNGFETDVDCGGPQCEPCYSFYECSVDSDCKSNLCDPETKRCTSCEDNIRNNAESDVDCGGPLCSACPDLFACKQNSDCVSNLCHDGECVSCFNGISDGDETDVDCGGSLCRLRCALDNNCVRDADCLTGHCDANTRRCSKVDPLSAFLCSSKNGVRDNSETDVDCGGQCALFGFTCDVAMQCEKDTDCTSNSCMGEVCVSCNDGLLNGDETDVDCGGSCGKCGDSLTCADDADCSSAICFANQCISCNDGLLNGDETDVDCGGSCGKCTGCGACVSDSDCVSEVCGSSAAQVWGGITGGGCRCMPLKTVALTGEGTSLVKRQGYCTSLPSDSLSLTAQLYKHDLNRQCNEPSCRVQVTLSISQPGVEFLFHPQNNTAVRIDHLATKADGARSRITGPLSVVASLLQHLTVCEDECMYHQSFSVEAELESTVDGACRMAPTRLASVTVGSDGADHLVVEGRVLHDSCCGGGVVRDLSKGHAHLQLLHTGNRNNQCRFNTTVHVTNGFFRTKVPVARKALANGRLSVRLVASQSAYTSVPASVQLYPSLTSLVSSTAYVGKVLLVEDACLECPTPATQEPTSSPSASPAAATDAPSRRPTPKPSHYPSEQPSEFPSASPTGSPSTLRPSGTPTGGPTVTPSSAGPSVSPTRAPSFAPVNTPTTPRPSLEPTVDPTAEPTTGPTVKPTGAPSASPSRGPTYKPTRRPTVKPTTRPSSSPTTPEPTTNPSQSPSQTPTDSPSSPPSSGSPSTAPSQSPTRTPTGSPSVTPTGSPSTAPSQSPTRTPTGSPSLSPTLFPTTLFPTGAPTHQQCFTTGGYEAEDTPCHFPFTFQQQVHTKCIEYAITKPYTGANGLTQPASPEDALFWCATVPSYKKTNTNQRKKWGYCPTECGNTSSPTQATQTPSSSPTQSPTLEPSASPSRAPSSLSPTASPTVEPSAGPSSGPSHSPTSEPTRQTASPSSSPSVSPILTEGGYVPDHSLCALPFTFQQRVYTECAPFNETDSARLPHIDPQQQPRAPLNRNSTTTHWCPLLRQYDVADETSRRQWGFCSSLSGYTGVPTSSPTETVVMLDLQVTLKQSICGSNNVDNSLFSTGKVDLYRGYFDAVSLLADQQPLGSAETVVLAPTPPPTTLLELVFVNDLDRQAQILNSTASLQQIVTARNEYSLLISPLSEEDELYVEFAPFVVNFHCSETQDDVIECSCSSAHCKVVDHQQGFHLAVFAATVLPDDAIQVCLTWGDSSEAMATGLQRRRLQTARQQTASSGGAPLPAPLDLDLYVKFDADELQAPCEVSQFRRACGNVSFVLHNDRGGENGPEALVLNNVHKTVYTFYARNYLGDAATETSGATAVVNGMGLNGRSFTAVAPTWIRGPDAVPGSLVPAAFYDSAPPEWSGAYRANAKYVRLFCLDTTGEVPKVVWAPLFSDHPFDAMDSCTDIASTTAGVTEGSVAKCANGLSLTSLAEYHERELLVRRTTSSPTVPSSGPTSKTGIVVGGGGNKFPTLVMEPVEQTGGRLDTETATTSSNACAWASSVVWKDWANYAQPSSSSSSQDSQDAPSATVGVSLDASGVCRDTIDTYDDAVDMCRGFVLADGVIGGWVCSMDELQADVTRGSGCSLDEHRVWSSTVCSVPTAQSSSKKSADDDAAGRLTQAGQSACSMPDCQESYVGERCWHDQARRKSCRASWEAQGAFYGFVNTRTLCGLCASDEDCNLFTYVGYWPNDAPVYDFLGDCMTATGQSEEECGDLLLGKQQGECLNGAACGSASNGYSTVVDGGCFDSLCTGSGGQTQYGCGNYDAADEVTPVVYDVSQQSDVTMHGLVRHGAVTLQCTPVDASGPGARCCASCSGGGAGSLTSDLLEQLTNDPTASLNVASTVNTTSDGECSVYHHPHYEDNFYGERIYVEMQFTLPSSHDDNGDVSSDSFIAIATSNSGASGSLGVSAGFDGAQCDGLLLENYGLTRLPFVDNQFASNSTRSGSIEVKVPNFPGTYVACLFRPRRASPPLHCPAETSCVLDEVAYSSEGCSCFEVQCPRGFTGKACAQCDGSDSDGDGVMDCEDACPDDPLKSTSADVATCGCGVVDTALNTADPDNNGNAVCNECDGAADQCYERSLADSLFGQSYRGCKQVTKSGLLCQPWSEQSPHVHNLMEGRSNHGMCSSGPIEGQLPDAPAAGTSCEFPFIYKNRKYDSCVTSPSFGGHGWCNTMPLGVNGQIPVVTSLQGLAACTPCAETRKPPPGLGQHNFCRNPDNAPGGPWCFTDDELVRWEYCDIPACDAVEEVEAGLGEVPTNVVASELSALLFVSDVNGVASFKLNGAYVARIGDDSTLAGDMMTTSVSSQSLLRAPSSISLVSRSSDGFKLLGCVKQAGLFASSQVFILAHASPKACSVKCARFAFFAIRSGNECLCGSSLPATQWLETMLSPTEESLRSNDCVTNGLGQESVAGIPCQFPFTYSGVEYSACLGEGSGGQGVCFTVYGTWGGCDCAAAASCSLGCSGDEDAPCGSSVDENIFSVYSRGNSQQEVARQVLLYSSEQQGSDVKAFHVDGGGHGVTLFSDVLYRRGDYASLSPDVVEARRALNGQLTDNLLYSLKKPLALFATSPGVDPGRNEEREQLLYVSDYVDDVNPTRILRFDSNDVLRESFLLSNADDMASSIAVDQQKGLIYVAIRNKHLINVYSASNLDSMDVLTSTGLLNCNTIGGGGVGVAPCGSSFRCSSSPDAFCQPSFIAVSAAPVTLGHLYIVDSGNKRLQQYNANGHFVRTVGAGVVTEPKAVAVSLWNQDVGKVYVLDGDRVVVFDSDGALLIADLVGAESLRFSKSLALLHPCSDESYCHGNGRCTIHGSCDCFDSYYGANCDTYIATSR